MTAGLSPHFCRAPRTGLLHGAIGGCGRGDDRVSVAWLLAVGDRPRLGHVDELTQVDD
jgi:hypothetical protein